MRLSIRPAAPGEEGLVLDFVMKLAVYEKLQHEVEATEDDMRTALFGAEPRCRCDLALWDDEPAGFALWFYNFSTFRGRAGIYIEDLFVEPHRRGLGIGKALLRALARRCRDEGLGRMQWSVLDWNAPSIQFYEALGAMPIDEWKTYRLTGEALDRLAE